MRIIIDTDKGRIILPKAFFSTLEKMNKILAEGGSDKKWTAEDYVREQFLKSYERDYAPGGGQGGEVKYTFQSCIM